MSALVFLLIAVVISAIGSAVLVLRNRRPTSVESGIDEFRREMSALAPPVPPKRPRLRNQVGARTPAADPDPFDPAGPAGSADPADPADPAGPADPADAAVADDPVNRPSDEAETL